MTIRLHHWLAMLILAALSSCYPGGAEYTDELDLVYTNYDKNVPFTSKRTFAISDSVIKISSGEFQDPDGDGMPDFLSPVYSVPVVTQIRQNMTSYGWTEVNKNDNPDVVFLVASMTTTNIYYYYDWWYWSWWYPGWSGGWGWYYPGYYPSYVSGYRSGSIFIQMILNENVRTAEQLPVAWNCIFNGLAEGSTAGVVSRLQNGINIAFAQSLYLKH